MTEPQDSFNYWVRDFVVDGAADTGPNKPSKDDARIFGEELQNVLDLLIEGQGAGAVAFATYPAPSGLAGFTGAGANVLGLVTNDAGNFHLDPFTSLTVPNNGKYRHHLSPEGWEWIGADDVAALDTRVDALEVLAQPIGQRFDTEGAILDIDGRLGGGSAVYLPRAIRITRDGVTAINQTAIGTADPRVSRHVKVTIPSTTIGYWVYFDTADTSYHLADMDGSIPASYGTKHHIATIFGRRVTDQVFQIRSVETLVPWFLLGRIVVEWDSVNSGYYKILVPNMGSFYSGAKVQTGTTAFYKEIDGFSFGAAGKLFCLYFSIPKLIAGEDPFVSGEITATTTYMADDPLCVPILYGFNGVYWTPKGTRPLGSEPAGSLKNQNLSGRADVLDNNVVPAFTLGNQAAQKVAVVDATAISMGFVYGWQSSTIGVLAGQVFCGFRVNDEAPGRFAFVRIWVESDVDNFCATPSATIIGNTSSQGFTSILLEKQWSVRLFSFIGERKWTQTDDKAVVIRAGYADGGSPFHQYKIVGIQGAYGQTFSSWVMRDDWPERANQRPIMVPKIHWLDEEPMPFYHGAAMYERSIKPVPAASLSFKSRNLLKDGNQPLAADGTLIDTSRVNGNMNYRQLVPDENTGRRHTAKFYLESTSSAAIASHALCVMFMGDSTIDFTGRGAFFVQQAQGYGALSVETLGTIANADWDAVFSANCEGRTGKQFVDYTGEDMSAMLPVTAANYAGIYLGGDDASRRLLNPFLRPAVGGDDDADVYYPITGLTSTVAVATTGQITLSGEQTIDGVVTSVSRVLVKNQGQRSDNGLYVSASGAWARATDMDTWAEAPGRVVTVTGGTVGAGTQWLSGAALGGAIGDSDSPIPFVPCVVAAVATTANITLSGEQTLDGVLTSASLVLVKNQTVKSQNGLYVSAGGAWSRSTKMDDWLEVWGSRVKVSAGTTQAGKIYLCISSVIGTLDTTDIVWDEQPTDGWTFDFSFYLSRNGWAAKPLTHIFIALIINDLGNNTFPQGQQQVVRSADRVLRSIRDWSSTAHVTFTLPALPLGEVGALTLRFKWNERHAPAYIAFLDWFNAAAADDDAIHINPGYLIMDPINGWDYDPVDYVEVNPAKCMATGNITLSGEQTLDGILTAGSRVFLANQADESENGLWLTGPGAWSRPSDFDDWSEVPNALIRVIQGNTLGGSTWLCTAAASGTIDTTDMPWRLFTGELDERLSASGFLHPRDENNRTLVIGDLAIVAATI